MKIDIAKTIERHIRNNTATALLGVPRTNNKYMISDSFNELFKKYLGYYGYHKFIDSIREQNIFAIEVPDGYGRKPIKEYSNNRIDTRGQVERTRTQTEADRIREQFNFETMKKLKDMSGVSSLKQQITKIGVTIDNRNTDTIGMRTVDGMVFLDNWVRNNGGLRLVQLEVLFQIVSDKNDNSKYSVMLNIDVSISVNTDMPCNTLHVVAYGADDINEILNQSLSDLVEYKLGQLARSLISTKQMYCKKFMLSENTEIYVNSFYGEELIQF